MASSKSARITASRFLARGEQRRLVHHVGQVRAGEARGARGDRLQVHVRRPASRSRAWISRICSRPRLSGRSTSTCRSKRPGRISALSRISGRLVAAMMMRPGAGVEAVHLGQQLVERLLALVVAAQRRPRCGVLPMASSSSMKMMHGALRLGLREQVAHPRRAHADEHLHELGAGEAEERHPRLARHRAGQQRLAGARRADQQHALGDAAAQPPELLRRLEELDDLRAARPPPRRCRPRPRSPRRCRPRPAPWRASFRSSSRSAAPARCRPRPSAAS